MSLPVHLFISDCDGALYDTRAPDWAAARPVRANYRRTTAGKLETLADVKATLRAGGFAWPGGYPLYFITRDGAALSFAAVQAQFRQVASDFMDDTSSGWRVEAVTTNEEDSELRCDHTGELIPSAYGDEDSDDPAQWVAGWNMPGYMPESEPAGFATWEEARDHLAAEMERAADEAHLVADAPQERKCDIALATLRNDAPTGEPFTITVSGYAWWIERAEA